MKKRLTLAGLILGCCFAVAQTGGGYYEKNPAGSAAPGHSDRWQLLPVGPVDQTNSPTGTPSQKTTVQGCLTRSADGAFLLSDASGNSYQLNDSASRLGQFVGKEIRVDGFGFSSESPGSMSAGVSNFRGPTQQINVTRVRKIDETCQTRSGNR